MLALVLMNGFFVAAEFALIRVRETQLDALVAKGWKRAKMARHIVRHLNSYLSATQLGVTMASLGLGYLGEPVFTTLLEPLLEPLGVTSVIWQHSISFAVGFSVLTFLNIVVGELVPKWLTMQKTLPVALWAARAVALVLFRLLSVQLAVERRGALAGAPAGHCAGRPGRPRAVGRRMRLVLAAAPQGATAGGRNLILNALDLRQRVAREIMRPRHEITAFDTDATLAECLALAERTRYSRFPLCDGGDVDKTRGVVHIKDLYALRDRARTAAELLPAARP